MGGESALSFHRFLGDGPCSTRITSPVKTSTRRSGPSRSRNWRAPWGSRMWGWRRSARNSMCLVRAGGTGSNHGVRASSSRNPCRPWKPGQEETYRVSLGFAGGGSGWTREALQHLAEEGIQVPTVPTTSSQLRGTKGAESLRTQGRSSKKVFRPSSESGTGSGRTPGSCPGQSSPG